MATTSPKRPTRQFLTPYSTSSDREGGGTSAYSSSTDTPGDQILPPSPHLPYFDKYPKRSERLKAHRVSRDDLDDYRATSSRLATSTRYGRSSSASGRPTLESPVSPVSKGRTSKDPDLNFEKVDDEYQDVYPFPSKVSPIVRSRRQFPSSSKTIHPFQSSSSSSPSTSPSTSPLYRSESPLATASYHERPKLPAFASAFYSPQDSTLNDGALVISPGSDVTEIDALVDQMNGHRKSSLELPKLPPSPWENVVTNSRKSGGRRHHPLSHPPIPKPPRGVTLGHSKMSWRNRSASTEASVPSRNDPLRPTLKANRNYAIVSTPSSPPSLSRSSGNSDQSSLHTCMEHNGADDATLVNDLSRNLRSVPTLDHPPSSPKTIIPSITDIIRTYAPEHLNAPRSTLPRSFGGIGATDIVAEVTEESDRMDY